MTKAYFLPDRRWFTKDDLEEFTTINKNSLNSISKYTVIRAGDKTTVTNTWGLRRFSGKVLGFEKRGRFIFIQTDSKHYAAFDILASEANIAKVTRKGKIVSPTC